LEESNWGYKEVIGAQPNHCAEYRIVFFLFTFNHYIRNETQKTFGNNIENLIQSNKCYNIIKLTTSFSYNEKFRRVWFELTRV